jgi:DNA-directed RNA polymerase subunit RPC12/RpoP
MICHPKPDIGHEKLDAKLRCANCGRKAREDENPDDEWRPYSDGVGELHVFCPECAEREFRG